MMLCCHCIHTFHVNVMWYEKYLWLEQIINPANMLHPISIQAGSAGKHWPEAGRMILARWPASGWDPFGQNLTQPAKTKLDLGWFCIILSRMSVEEWNGIWKWETGSRLFVSCQKLCQTIPAHWLAFRPDECSKPWPGHPDRIRVSFAQHGPWLLCKPELKRMQEVGSGIYDPARFWLHAGCNGHNENASRLDPACLLGTDFCV